MLWNYYNLHKTLNFAFSTIYFELNKLSRSWEVKEAESKLV